MADNITLFINYRRADHAHFVYALRTHLRYRFGDENVFMDLKIPAFRRFEDVLREKIAASDAVLSVIGPNWLGLLAEKADDEDWVKTELEIALELGKPIFPICIAGGMPPNPNQLPASLRTCFDLNAARIPDEKVLEDVIDGLADDIMEGVRYFRTLNAPPAPTIEVSTPIPRREPTLADDVAILEAALAIQNATPPAPPIPDILPGPFEWCYIPGGEVHIEEGGYVPIGGQAFSVEPFWMAKYCITNAQFDVFVQAKDGYANVEWWNHCSEAQEWRVISEKASATSFAGNNLPRTNVNWYTAVAFSRWLSAKTSQNITLPSEQQWQFAAQGSDGRTYPWGENDPNPSLANYKEILGCPVSVGTFPEGASPFGILNMAGNVWEWCSTSFDTGDEHCDHPYSYSFLLRGGGWDDIYDSNLRTGTRLSDYPFIGESYIGFRLAHL